MDQSMGNKTKIEEIDAEIERLGAEIEALGTQLKEHEAELDVSSKDSRAAAFAGINNLKRSLILTAVLMIVTLSLFLGQTFAYFTDYASVDENRIEAGGLGIELIKLDEDGADWSTDPIRMLPSSTHEYGGVSVQNTATLPVYLRIKVEKSIINSENEIPVGWEDLVICNFMENDEALIEENRDLWVYHDGYYYYKNPLEVGAVTTSLFDTVTFSESMGNEFANSSIEIKLICQAVQSRGNSPDPITAWGWPENN